MSIIEKVRFLFSLANSDNQGLFEKTLKVFSLYQNGELLKQDIDEIENFPNDAFPDISFTKEGFLNISLENIWDRTVFILLVNEMLMEGIQIQDGFVEDHPLPFFINNNRDFINSIISKNKDSFYLKLTSARINGVDFALDSFPLFFEDNANLKILFPRDKEQMIEFLKEECDHANLIQFEKAIQNLKVKIDEESHQVEYSGKRVYDHFFINKGEVESREVKIRFNTKADKFERDMDEHEDRV